MVTVSVLFTQPVLSKAVFLMFSLTVVNVSGCVSVDMVQPGTMYKMPLWFDIFVTEC